LYKTRRRVLILDRIASVAITVVGLSVILAVAGMMLFLIGSSLPLFNMETLDNAGLLGNTGPADKMNAGGMLLDENAPVAILLPHASGGHCKILARSVIPAAGNAKPADSVSQTFVLTKSAADASGLPLTLAKVDEQTATAGEYSCSAQGRRQDARARRSKTAPRATQNSPNVFVRRRVSQSAGRSAQQTDRRKMVGQQG